MQDITFLGFQLRINFFLHRFKTWKSISNTSNFLKLKLILQFFLNYIDIFQLITAKIRIRIGLQVLQDKSQI